MMASMEMVLRRGRRQVRRWLEIPGVRKVLQGALWGAGGFFFSAAALRNTFQPLAMGLICAAGGWRAVAVCLGSLVGFSHFWGAEGLQGILWSVLGLGAAMIPETGTGRHPLLIPALAAFLVSGTGLGFQLLGREETTMGVYLLRILVAAGACLVFTQALRHRDAITDWVVGGIGVLALAPVMPLPFLGLGYIAGAMAAGSGAFPAAALAGLGLDLARVTPVPMGVVLCSAYFFRLLPPSLQT